MGGLEWRGIFASGYFYKGDTKRQGDSDRIRAFGAELGYIIEKEDWAIQSSVDYLSNFADTDTLSTKVTSTTLKKEIPAYAFNLTARYKQFSFVTELISANSSFDSADLAWKTGGAKPSTTQIELSYTIPMKHETTLSIGQQTSKESVGAGLTESRLLYGINSIVNEHASVGIEHFTDQDYATTECSGTTCGTGKKGYTTTVKFALTF
jgi:hypothetical protein